jgi:hypothetical protein
MHTVLENPMERTAILHADILQKYKKIHETIWHIGQKTKLQ